MLTLRLKKRSDGGSAFTLVRSDGTSTWQRQDRHAAFFAHHDLVHLAVERTLGLREAFYGLVESGWDFDDFLPPYPRGPLPLAALWAETIVGMLDAEQAHAAHDTSHDASRMSAEELNAQVALKFDSDGLVPPGRVTEEQLTAIRLVREELFARWRTLPAGETLELSFST